MKKYLVHWHAWDCPGHKPHHNYTNARGLVNCPRCLRRLQSQLTPVAGDGAVAPIKCAECGDEILPICEACAGDMRRR